MNLKKYHTIKLRIFEQEDVIVKTLKIHDDYSLNQTHISVCENSSLLVLEKRDVFENIFQVLTFSITSENDYCDVVIVESKISLGLFNICKRKEIHKIYQDFIDNEVEVEVIENEETF